MWEDFYWGGFGRDAGLAYLRSGDTLVVWKLDRLGRSLRHLITVVTDLQTDHKGLRSLQEAMDTTTPGGKLIFHVFGALAEFERELIRKRTHAGLTAARARGRSGGRSGGRHRVMTVQTLRMAQQLLADAIWNTPAESQEVRTMPVTFSPPEQEAQYGHYPGDPSPAQLAQYFYLEDGDRAFLATLRQDSARWGCAVQGVCVALERKLQ